jgi:hypothetical protein
MTSPTVIRLITASAVILAAALTPGTAAADTPTRVWDRVAQCESNGNWHINTHNGYRGGLQFSPETWREHGGKGQPEDASKDEQIRIAERVLKSQGWGAWPVCSRRAGLR